MMAIFDGEGRYLLVGAVLGATAATLSRGVPRSVAEVTRPLGKALVRIGMTGTDRALELYGRLTETVEDLAAEVYAERAVVEAERPMPAGPAAAAAPSVEGPVGEVSTAVEIGTLRRPAARRQRRARTTP
jgi:hypothetical protein